jgi:hypothetical protein
MPQSGIVLIYSLNPDKWELLQSIASPKPCSYARFGASVAIHKVAHHMAVLTMHHVTCNRQ